MSKLPLNLDDLLRQRTVEGDRIEYKAGWNPDAVVRTLCAFANDFENLGGGYIVIGQDCDEQGQPIFPPVGLNDNQLDPIQRELLGYCNLIQPTYFPILSVEKYETRNLIVLWSPGGQNRPYKSPRAVTAKVKEYHYYIRRFSSTIELKANSEDEQELLRLTATVPFDDRQCRLADVDDLRPGLLQSYLKEVGSELYKEASKMPLVELGRQMNIVDGADEFVKPRNVGVLFFHDEPRIFLPGAQIDVVIFPKGPGGGELIEKTFHGPLHEQVRDALRYLESNVIRERVVIGEPITDANLFHLAPLVCLKFRGRKLKGREADRVTKVALANYVVNSDPEGRDHGLERRPMMAFTLCYVATHLALDLLDERQAEAILTYCEDRLEEE